MEFTIYSFAIDISIMSGLLFISQLLRSKYKIFQYTYMPSSLVAGLIGLSCNQILPFSEQANAYPYLFICILFGGLFIGKREEINVKHILNKAGNTFFVNTASEFLGFGTALFFGGYCSDLRCLKIILMDLNYFNRQDLLEDMDMLLL